MFRNWHEERMGGERGRRFMHGMPLRGMLPIAVLSLIKDKPTYGGEIYKSLQEKFGIDVPRPIIYVLLRRLEHAGMMVSKWETAESGPAKRRYTISEDGLEFYSRGLEHLKRIRKLIDVLVGEGPKS